MLLSVQKYVHILLPRLAVVITFYRLSDSMDICDRMLNLLYKTVMKLKRLEICV